MANKIGSRGLTFGLIKVVEWVKDHWYRARLEFPEGEVPQRMRERLAQPNDYTNLSFFNHRRTHGRVRCPRAQLDDGLLDLHIMPAYGRAAGIKFSAWVDNMQFDDVTQPCPL